MDTDDAEEFARHLGVKSSPDVLTRIMEACTSVIREAMHMHIRVWPVSAADATPPPAASGWVRVFVGNGHAKEMIFAGAAVFIDINPALFLREARQEAEAREIKRFKSYAAKNGLRDLAMKDGKFENLLAQDAYEGYKRRTVGNYLEEAPK